MMKQTAKTRAEARLRLLLSGVMLVFFPACTSNEKFYTSSDFNGVEKCDAHFHYLTYDTSYIVFARSLNFKILTPVWDGEEVSVKDQISVASAIKKACPGDFAFFGTFDADSVNSPGFSAYARRSIIDFMDAGASGLKIWKNIGMVIRDSTGKFIMIDDPLFDPLFSFLVREEIPVIAHLGEPRDCWLPLDEMTDKGNASYYRNNPQYHMYKHPEVPSYESQINATRNLLLKYPRLKFTGAHLASIEWSVDELSRLMDECPNLKVDLAARISQVQAQSDENISKVRDFFIRYQDRIVYGTDFEVHDIESGSESMKLNLQKGWQEHWNYLATDSCRGHRGLKLPSSVIDKVYYHNTAEYFSGKER